jgi:presenilin-like A22 family membrane protease
MEATGAAVPQDEEAKPAATDAAGEKKSVRDAMFLGLGDIVIPSILVVSALTFTGAASAIGAFLGIAAGYVFLMAFVLRGKPQAGLPALNGGAFLGFVGGFWLEHGTYVFW